MKDLFNKILEFETNTGGQNAEKGFDFQYACAMSDMVDRYIENKDFIICLENVDDYIIVDENNEVTICQCKNYSKWSCTINNLTKNDKYGNSIWGKMTTIYSGLKSLLIQFSPNINSILIINTKNNISIIVESENKEAYRTETYLNFLNLKDANRETKNFLCTDGTIDFEHFFIKRSLDHDLFDQQVKDKLNQAIVDKKGLSAKFNPIALYNTLIDNLRQKSKVKEGVNLQNFIRTIDELISIELERFFNYSDVKDYNNYSSEFDKAKVAKNYNELKNILNSREEKLSESIIFSKMQKYKNEPSFDVIVDRCQHADVQLHSLDVEKIIAYALLCKGEKYEIGH